MSSPKNSSFEDNIKLINNEIAKRKSFWNLSSIRWMDFDDVAQIVRIHIYEKWKLYDQSKPLGPWLNKVIAHQIKNIIRNIYGNYVRPCAKCSASEGDNLCKIYTSQSTECPLYAAWEKNKKKAYEIKMPLPIDNFINTFGASYSDEQDIHTVAQAIHEKMKQVLKPNEWTLYKYLFIDHLPEEEVAKKMGYKSNETNRRPGYKQLRNIRKTIIKKVKLALHNNEIDIL